MAAPSGRQQAIGNNETRAGVAASRHLELQF
jgi:hypothetical protein